MNQQIDELRAKLLASYLLFTQFFYKERTGREFEISEPIGRESHHRIIAKELTLVSKLETNRLIMNVPPGHGKSEMVIHFIAWCMARYPDSAFLYISYGFDLAAKHTHTVKQIIELPIYRELFGVEIRSDSKAKDYFTTTSGGFVKAFGSSGGITGFDGGLPHVDRFSGAIIMDDMHKPDDIHSDTMREHVWTNYQETIFKRKRGPNVPFIFIGQRLHEDDLPAKLLSGMDGYPWKKVILKSIDDAGNALYPQNFPLHDLLIEKEISPYVFSAQNQQDPIPAGGGIFKPEWFLQLDETPKIISTFITVDSAETNKSYNDATVFSFWGLYKVIIRDIDTHTYALHWIDCNELRVEPKDLESEFLKFWAGCMRYSIKPKFTAIEKKSTGVTLLSILKNTPGIKVIDIERTKASGNKTSRFLEAQPYIANKQITLPKYANHTNMCIDHMTKITANDSHRFDDIADTLYDAVKLALIDKVFINQIANKTSDDTKSRMIMSNYNKINRLRSEVYANRPGI